MAQSLELTAGPCVSPICHTSEECPSHDVPGMRRHRNQIALFVSRSLNNPFSGFPRTPPPLRRGYPANAIDLQWCPHRFASVNQLDSQPTGSNLPTKAQRIGAILQSSRFQAYRLRRKQNWWTALLIQVHDLDPNRTVSQSIVAQGQSHRTGGAQR